MVLEAQGDAVVKPKWDQALPLDVRAVLEEFDDVFPQELPQGLTPVRQGVEDWVAHRTFYCTVKVIMAWLSKWTLEREAWVSNEGG